MSKLGRRKFLVYGSAGVATSMLLKACASSDTNSAKYPVMSVSIAEEEVRQIGKEYLKGHYASWNYYQTVESPENDTFVKAFKAKYGEDRVTNDPMEAAYIMVYLWKQAVEAAGTTDLEAVRKAAVGQQFSAPGGLVTMQPNHHISKTVRIGQVRDDGLFDIVWSTDAPLDPIPWNQYVADTKGFACDWTDPAKGGKYKIEDYTDSATKTNTDSSTTNTAASGDVGGDGIKVGILHSLSGTMAISETTVVDAEMLAIDEINAAGGVLGKKIIPITEDGASDWPMFAEKAAKLIDKDKVVTVFGCWTSASRKAVLPVFESKKHMLWYPVQYEGQECSNNIFYTGAAPNQQIEPAVDWLLKNKGKEFFLVGSDYVFPRTANTIIKAQLEAKGGKVVGEDYLPLGNTEVTPIITKIKAALPNGGVIFNSLNGDSNVAFFKQMQGAGLNP